ncbi:hypothetical protein HK100_010274 [Physocladia obscura]|uniref:Uncharacterized protein n=1 Tax=Physocladia obscura TaxID=109957 RepID=A0AAD5T348_9FUNG|nr:hypothetical protein HK100_010274 [Physocladia obscura]
MRKSDSTETFHRLSHSPNIEFVHTFTDEEQFDGKYDVKPVDASFDDIYDIVDSLVPRTDNPMEPVLTFRVLVLGTLIGLAIGAFNTIFSLRSNPFTMNPFFALIISYPLGNFMYWTLSPRIYTVPYMKWQFSLNPGPFSFKEHTLIYICAKTAGSPPYAVYNIIAQKYLLKQDISLAVCIAFAIISQLIGYGIAGLCRKFLVRPIAMLWPRQLSAIATLRSFHRNSVADDNYDETGSQTANTEEMKKKFMSKNKFFWMCAGGMFVYQFLPGYIMPLLSSFPLLCYIGPFNQQQRMIGSAVQGVGVGSLSFDWAVVGQIGPIITPLWAIVNQLAGTCVFLWFIVPLLWTNNAFGADQLLGTDISQGPNGSAIFPIGQALNSVGLFNRNGTEISPLNLVTYANNTYVLNEAVYNTNRPIYITTYYAMQTMALFVAFSASVSHAALWHGKDIVNRLSTAMKDLDSDDIHAQLMDQYREVSDTWYAGLLCIATISAFSICSWGGFVLPWWGVILSIAMVGITIIPFGIIEGISGQRVATNIESEMIFGFIMPNRIVENMTFKTLSYVGTMQGLTFLEDLKLGHFVKIPPRTMFGVQITATVMSAIFNTIILTKIYEDFGMSTNPPVGWNAYNYKLFLSSGAIWGAIGSSRFFGFGTPYGICLWGFVIGAIAPIVPYLLHTQFPTGNWHLVNVPLIMWMRSPVGSIKSDVVTPLLVAWVVNGVVKKRWFKWWQRYAYLMSSAFDFGSGLGLVVCFLIVMIAPTLLVPIWVGNPADGEGCASAQFLLCAGREEMGIYVSDNQCL